MNKTPFYITTPIYYVTDAPHIGHLYTTLAADIMSSYQRLCGRDVRFLTGTDEHGQKIEKKAKETGETPQALADRVVERYLQTWKLFDITYNDFIRTTEERHKKTVIQFIEALLKSGDIYLDEYEGWYCVPDETFWLESQLKEGNCPDCGRPVEKLKEESYFFRLSKYVPLLKEHIEKNPGFITPESRKNEVLGFLAQDVKDISASRTSIHWGIRFPSDSKAKKEHIVYVWFDALTNYVSSLGGPDTKLFEKYWASAHHLVGKDILRFHAVYWPAFLMALGLPLPKKIIAHGWLTDSNRKISKSLGNMVDPAKIASLVGTDGIRYFLFREFVFGMDGEYTEDLVYQKINSDLANSYGNCVNRVTSMMIKYLGNEIELADSLPTACSLQTLIEEQVPKYHSALENYLFHKAIEATWEIITAVNKFIEQEAPWKMAKDTTEEGKRKLKDVLVHCHESLRIASVLAQPFIPETSKKALNQLGMPVSEPMALSFAGWGKGYPKDPLAKIQLTLGAPIFMRVEAPKVPT